MSRTYSELTRLIERLHRRFIDVIRAELNRLGVRDLNGVQALLLANIGDEDFVIRRGERIAQLVIAKHERADWIEVETLDDTARGAGGFGSTGR